MIGDVFSFVSSRFIAFGARRRKGDMELEEIVKIIILVLVIVVAIWGISMLFLGKGGRVIDSIKDLFRFG